jgi:hypothetical protein
MNMNPDETQIALWLDDEMSGDELAEMDAWAVNQPERIRQREDLRRFRSQIATLIPASEPLPFAEFFMARIQQGMRTQEARSSRIVWKTWLMPMAACASMIFAFSLGRGTLAFEKDQASAPATSLYIPEEGVSAAWVAGSKSKPGIIVLEGVRAIPDSIDFSETVYVPSLRESDSTATHQPKNAESTKQ